MKRARWAALAIAALVAVWALRLALAGPLPVTGAVPEGRPPLVSGVVHVHTRDSDGGGTAEEVIAAARAVGLDFVAITDHNRLDGARRQGWHDGVLVLSGTEVSTEQGHLLGLGVGAEPAFRFSGDAQDALEDIAFLGGHAFAAHPSSPVDDFRWDGVTLPGAWGLEVINGDSQWRAAGLWRLLRTAAASAVNPEQALLGGLTLPGRTLELWDRLLQVRDVAGLTGADAHSRLPISRGLSARFPSYEALMGIARNHVWLPAPLSGNAEVDARAVVEALAAGHSWIGLDALAPADGFVFRIESAEGARWEVGETVPPGPGLTARVGGALPDGATILIRHDGAPFASGTGELAVGVSAPGVYRVEVRVPGWRVPWVMSNPIYVFDPATERARRLRAALPEPPAPPPGEPLDAFEAETGFHAEFDASSEVREPILAPGGGWEGGGALRLAFRLGEPGPERPHTWCALVERRERDLSGARGLAFRVRGDGVYRLWVQVRDANPASAEDGVEWWFASVRTAEEWRDVALPFERLRSIDPASDGRLDLDAVRGLVFLVDPGADRPGTEGTIWIDDLRVY